jgi:CBS domain-containing protein
MKTVRELLEGKSGDIWTVDPDSTVFDALRFMAEKNIGAVLVLDAEERLVGIFSERDYARKIVLQGKSSRETPVLEVMSRNLHTVKPEQSVRDCMTMMTDLRIRHLPVLDAGRLVGMISIGDVLKSIIDYQDFLIEQYENYITGRL